MRHLYTARDAMDASFLRGLLEQEGIRAVVQGEALQETWGKPEPDAGVAAVGLGGRRGRDRAGPIVDEYRRRDAANAAVPEEGVRPFGRRPPDVGVPELRPGERGAVHRLLALRLERSSRHWRDRR
jgi:hypothetical protein